MTSSFPSRQGCTTQHTLSTPQGMIPYMAEAQWQVLYDNHEQPVAELFYVAYTVDAQEPSQRPITFVVNGGPGAASAYLHMGAMGPKRVVFQADGGLPKPPVRVEDNGETWLPFTDLVFIDPIGTGFSRALPKPEATAAKASPSPTRSPSAPDGEESASQTASDPAAASAMEQAKTFWNLDQDLKALGEFIQRYLSTQHRWLSPIFIAGESYGGFRVAKLARLLQQSFGVGLNGTIIISPVLEFELLGGTDYTLTGWATAIPSMAAAAVHHGRVSTADSPAAHAAKAETFARQTLIPFLALGNLAPEAERQRVYAELAELIGLPLEVVQRHRGRLEISTFARELLRDQGRILGLYDASVTAIDPFPNRLLNEGTDPTLDGLDRLFTGAINSHLRSTLGVSTPLTYHLLNYEVFKAWKFLSEKEDKQGFVGAVDDLRVAMALNPHMQVAINHGLYDLVTPYFSSNLLVDLMALSPDLQPNLTLQPFPGGHMFYTWEASRQQWQRSMQAFYQNALS